MEKSPKKKGSIGAFDGILDKIEVRWFVGLAEGQEERRSVGSAEGEDVGSLDVGVAVVGNIVNFVGTVMLMNVVVPESNMVSSGSDTISSGSNTVSSIGLATVEVTVFSLLFSFAATIIRAKPREIAIAMNSTKAKAMIFTAFHKRLALFLVGTADELVSLFLKEFWFRDGNEQSSSRVNQVRLG
mmetsp:Transcript_3836/g.6887  ORF Transcript_3836/g.6887 Transcript_3836/m.6887 type:complete len:185 (-) Transcript_3836:270-824(-)